MGREIAITLTDEQQAQLEALARKRNQTAEQVATRAIGALLRQDAEDVAAIQEGIDAADAGDVRDLEEVMQEMRALLEARIQTAGH